MLDLGSLFKNRYRIERYLGQGGMADVYQAFDTVNRFYVAIKLIREDIENKEELFQRFSYEIRIAAAVQNHTNIVKILDFGKHDEIPYMITEYINGQTLKDSLIARRTYNFEESCYIIIQILDALEELHLRGIVHRDIKPQNVYILPSGTIKVADFGISIFANQISKINEKRKIVGTPQYLSPEVIISNDISSLQDIYATGITFFEILAGRVPYDNEDPHDVCVMQVEKPFPSLNLFRPNVPSSIVKIIEKACEKEKKLRYQNVHDMKEDIEDLLNNKKNLRSQNWFERLLGLKGK